MEEKVCGLSKGIILIFAERVSGKKRRHTAVRTKGLVFEQGNSRLKRVVCTCTNCARTKFVLLGIPRAPLSPHHQTPSYKRLLFVNQNRGN
jgi:hypothetical protein